MTSPGFFPDLLGLVGTMSRDVVRYWLLAATTSLGAVGCDSAEAPAPKEPAPAVVEARVEDKAEPPTEPPVAPPEPPEPRLRTPSGGAAYFLLEPERLVLLDDDGFDAIPAPDHVDRLEPHPEGGPFVHGFATVYRLEHGALRQLTEDLREGGFFTTIAPDDIWARRMAYLFHWDGRTWRREPFAHAEKPFMEARIEDNPRSMVVDDAQRVWVATTEDVLVRSGPGAWQVVPRSKLGGRPEELTIAEGHALLRLHNDRFKQLDASDGIEVEPAKPPVHLAWAKQDRKTLRMTVVQATPKGQRSFVLGRDIDGLTTTNAVGDAHGRIWTATAAGVTIIDADGNSTKWPMGTIPELVGRVRSIALVNDGPTTLPDAGPVQRATARGRLVIDDAPVAGANIELCTHALAITIPPCAKSRPVYTATSGEDGTFEVPDVAVGVYSLAVEHDGVWRLLHREDRFVLDANGTDFGELHADRGPIARARHP